MAGRRRDEIPPPSRPVLETGGRTLMSHVPQTPEAAQELTAKKPAPGRWPGGQALSLLATRAVGIIAVCLVAGMLVWLGLHLATRDLLPGIGAAADRWWTALLLVSIAIAAAGFLSVVALVKWTLTRNLGKRAPDGTSLVFPTNTLLLQVSLVIVVCVLLLAGSLASPEARQSADRAYRADLAAAGRELVSPLTDAWRHANRSPVVVGERSPAVLNQLPPVAEQLARQKERLERWRAAADELVSKAEKMDRPTLREIDGFFAEPAAGDRPSFARPEETIFQVVQAATPEPVKLGDWFEADTHSARKGDPVYLWFAPRAQVNTDIPAALKELAKAREELLIRASRLRARELVNVANTLETGANYADPDKLHFREAVHPLELLAVQADRVKQLIAQDHFSFESFQADQLDEWRKDNLRGTQPRWNGGLGGFTNVAGLTVVRPRNDVYVTIQKLLTIGREHCLAAPAPGGAAGPVLKPECARLNYALTLVPSWVGGFVPPIDGKSDKAQFMATLGIDYDRLKGWSDAMSAPVSQSAEPARTEQKVLTAYEEIFDALAGLDPALKPKWADGLKELRRQVVAWNEAREQLRGFVALLENYKERQPSDAFDPFYGTALAQCVGRLRGDIDGLPNPFDAGRLATDPGSVRSNLIELAKQRAWQLLRMTPDHPFLKFPAQWPPDLSHPVLLEARIQEAWEKDVIPRKSDQDVLAPDGVERLASELAVKAREQMVATLSQIADELAAEWYAAVTGAPLEQARGIGRAGVRQQIKSDDETDKLKPDSFWNDGVAKAQLPYWNREYWARPEHRAEYVAVVAETRPPSALPIATYWGVQKNSPNATPAMHAVLKHHRLLWDDGCIDKLIKAFDQDNFAERDDQSKIGGAYWTLLTASPTGGFGWPNPFHQMRVRGDQLLKGESTTKLNQKANDNSKPATTIDDEISRRRSDPITVYEQLSAYYGSEADKKILFRDPNLRNLINSYLEEKRRKASSGGVRNTGGGGE
jgi:hypothetical protein